MAGSGREVLIKAEVLKPFCVGVLCHAGMPEEEAEIVADNLVQADLRGVDTHGVSRLHVYVERLKRGLVLPKTESKIVKETPTTALVDGGNGMGAVVGVRAMRLAIEKAQAAGTGFVAVKNSNHFGAAAYFAMMALPYDMIGLTLTNGPAVMAPWGASRSYFGTNPFAVAIPSLEEPPVVLDMAASVAARGKIIMAAKKQESIPLGWAIDPEGNPTTDPEAALKGSLLPLGYKGYGIAFIVEILSGILTGGPFGPGVGELYRFEKPQEVCHLFGALAVEAFTPVQEFKQRVDRLIREVRATPKAPGVEKIYFPGEIEWEKAKVRSEQGIPLSEAVYQELARLGEACGLTLGIS